MNSHLLQGNLLLSMDYDLAKQSKLRKFSGLFSFMKPVYAYEGQISLTPNEILILGENPFSIRLNAITELYLGFDELYPASYVKNFGLFWQPLRIKTSIPEMSSLYMVIDYNGISSSNKIWYETLVDLCR